MKIWMIRSGKNGEVEDLALSSGYALIGWAKLGDLSDISFPKQIKDLFIKKYNDKSVPKSDHLSNGSIGHASRQIYKFKKIINVGDICVLRMKREKDGFIIGYVTGEYEHLPNNPDLGCNGRRVKWMSGFIPRADVLKDLSTITELDKNFTVYQIFDEEVKIWIEDIRRQKKYGWKEEPEFTKYEWRTVDESFRKKVESAMVEYDSPGNNLFSKSYKSNRSRNYWVRSTVNERGNTQYPVQAIAAHSTNHNIDLNAVRWTFFDACTVLHNAGYLIYDNDGNLVFKNGISDDYLVREQDWFRKVIVNYFIAPAFEAGQKILEINTDNVLKLLEIPDNIEIVNNILTNIDSQFSGIKLESTQHTLIKSFDTFTYTFTNDFQLKNTQIKSCKEVNVLNKPSNLIYYGPPGTGKTYKSIREAVRICIGDEEFKKIESDSKKIKSHYRKLSEEKRIVFVTFHQSFSYQEFVEGLRPATSKNNGTTVSLELKQHVGIFKSICIRANNEIIKIANSTDDSETVDSENTKAVRSDSSGIIAPNFVLIIDEINRANISKIFGELITILEVDKRIGADNEIRVNLPYSGEEFGAPKNLHIIGTMNTADRSIALLDTALRRRFIFEELMPDSDLVPDEIVIGKGNLRKLFSRINERIEYLYDREHQIGHTFFMNCKNIEDVGNVFRERIIPLLSEYFFDDRSKIVEILEYEYPEISDQEYEGCFFNATPLSSAGLRSESQETDAEPRIRWTVRKSFDFEQLFPK